MPRSGRRPSHVGAPIHRGVPANKSGKTNEPQQAKPTPIKATRVIVSAGIAGVRRCASCGSVRRASGIGTGARSGASSSTSAGTGTRTSPRATRCASLLPKRHANRHREQGYSQEAIPHRLTKGSNH